MYYSYLSTGNLFIDGQHSNIDCLIYLCRQDDEWSPVARHLISALSDHIDSEEKICWEERLNITEEHLTEHKQLKKHLAVINKQVSNGAMEKEEFLTTLRQILLNHILTFDKHLKPDCR